MDQCAGVLNEGSVEVDLDLQVDAGQGLDVMHKEEYHLKLAREEVQACPSEDLGLRPKKSLV